MPATVYTKNNILNYNLGLTPTNTPPDPLYLGLSLSLIDEDVNWEVQPSRIEYTGTVVTLNVTNSPTVFSAGDVVTVEGVNAGYSVTNVDGTWTLDSASSTQIVFTVSSTPTGTTPQVADAGNVIILIIEEPTTGSYARKSFDNDKTSWSVSTAGTLSNAIDLAFVTATADWGIALSVFIADASTGGRILWFDTLAPTITVLNTMTVTFEIGALDASIT